MSDAQDNLASPDGHRDLSIRNTDEWPTVWSASMRGVGFGKCGDPDVGPSVGVLSVTPMLDELDWKHTIDPMHYHGSDQFRIVLDGEWVLARRPFGPGEFVFQEAGRVYQESPGQAERTCVLSSMGDRRGEPGTIKNDKDKRSLTAFMESRGLVAPGLLTEGGQYPHPAGPKGIPAVATTIGGCERGYLWSSFADTTKWWKTSSGQSLFAGVWGEPVAGPVVYMIKAGSDQIVVPPSTFATERFLAVMGGSCEIGSSKFETGYVRFQPADSHMDAVLSGDRGLEAVLILADRRAVATVTVPKDELASQWKDDLASMLSELELAPTLRRASDRAQ